jgi:transglutaminase superfamily protein
MTRLVKFFRRGWSDRGLFCEALALLLWAKLLIHWVPFRRLAPRLGRAQAETPPTVAPAERAVGVKVSWAVQAVARHLPLGFVCLPQAIAAQWMLRRRGLSSTLYLGVAADPERPAALIAHAWLRLGDKIVTGESEAAKHRKLASFADVRV